jgi:hypothetical protein
MWSGNTVPSGWILCDGTNRTPNLQNKFILSSSLENVNTSGGSLQIGVNNLPKHTHPVTITDDGHSHTLLLDVGENADTFRTTFYQPLTNKDTDGQPNSTGPSKTNISIDIGETGSGEDYYPPYYCLAFIMKL